MRTQRPTAQRCFSFDAWEKGGEPVSIHLKRATLSDAEALHRMQIEAFAGLLAKYQDAAINPACESLDRIREKLGQPYTRYYFILEGRRAVGGIRVVDHGDPSLRKAISPLFVLPECRGRGIAQQAIAAVERLHGPNGWALDTILEEPGNCHLYEKMGFRRTGEVRRINPRMTLVEYEKD